MTKGRVTSSSMDEKTEESGTPKVALICSPWIPVGPPSHSNRGRHGSGTHHAEAGPGQIEGEGGGVSPTTAVANE